MSRLFALLLAGLFAAGQAQVSKPMPPLPDNITLTPEDCTCGYLDPATQQLYTEALIYYFNETIIIDPEIFTVESYANKKEQGWNSVFKVGAKPNNVQIKNYFEFVPDPLNASHWIELGHWQSLELHTNASDKNHLVNGGELRTVRQDIQFGSFQAAMKGAAPFEGGTALSFALKFNSSQSLAVDMMNMKDPDDARISNLVNGEWPAEDSVTNYTTYAIATGINPWMNFTNVRMEWNQTDVNFFTGDIHSRSITEKDRTLPKAGQSLRLSTWSTGDKHYMEGPPTGNGSTAHILWVRNFFNSSAMTAALHDDYDQRCSTPDAPVCYTDNPYLRGSSTYLPAATLKWQEPPADQTIRKTAGIVAGCCSTFGILALINVFFRRTPWHKLVPGRGSDSGSGSKNKEKRTSNPESLQTYLTHSLPWIKQKNNRHSTGSATNSDSSGGPVVRRSGSVENTSTSGIQTPLPPYGARTPASGSQTPAPGYETPRPHATHVAGGGLYRSASLASLRSAPSAPQPEGESVPPCPRNGSHEKELAALQRISEVPRHAKEADFVDDNNNNNEDDISPVSVDEKAAVRLSLPSDAPVEPAGPTTTESNGEKRESIIKTQEIVTPVSAAEPAKPTTKPAPTKRIDYLAGLVAVACMGVTLHHFVQTFWPWVADGYGPGAHYPRAERWIKIFVGDYILTQLWIGPFFLTATRFLTTNYLKNGNLEDIAKKEIRRAPRLFGPIVITSALEYFLISMGLMASLEWLPSVSWSTWPYVAAQPNFGAYLNNLVELGYAMPNMIPEIVQHYCVGVLWTVPVQLQFTYVVLAAAVLIRDIKHPKKRFGFYAVMILTGWYAKSWSACHWCGLVLSDLEATYKWRVYLRARPLYLYTVITFAFIFATGAPLIAVFSQRFSFASWENSIHPSPPSGRPILLADGLTYPGYNEPTFAVLGFSIGLQILVELSTGVQWVLSTKVVLLMHPHIMTVYLTHGFVMWTWGAWIAVTLTQIDTPYWANLLVTLVTTYGFIFLLARFLTPLIEFPTQALMRNLDRWMKDESVPKRQTTAPFSKALVVGRHQQQQQSSSTTGEDEVGKEA